VTTSSSATSTARQHGYRPNILSVGYRVGKDHNSLLSYWYDGPVITIDPASTGSGALIRFLDAYNEFCIGRDGKQLLNQTPQLTPASCAARTVTGWRRSRGRGRRTVPRAGR
jgi:hypothetical protein